MASELHGRPARPGQHHQQQQQHQQHHGFANSTGGAVGGGAGGPPPSTLAAQLVENISASAAAKSSRPDETTELKRLFATIEKVKNDPACLTTHDERVEHNHLLVYVCGGVFLESLKLDDAFTDGERLRADALKAVNFLRVTIKETPTVLKCTTDGKVFLGRGAEPLWVWILPKLLRMLGHRRCVGIAGEIEELGRFVLLLAAGDAGLWGLGKELMEYFRANLSGKFAWLVCWCTLADTFVLQLFLLVSSRVFLRREKVESISSCRRRASSTRYPTAPPADASSPSRTRSMLSDML
jgi:serine/threonine-protein kinase ATR